MSKNIYLMRIMLSMMAAFLIGVTMGYFGNAYLTSAFTAICIAALFLYEALSADHERK